MKRKTVLVIGGGLAGCAVAKGLEKSSTYNVKLFERDTHASSRHQGLVIGLSQQAVDILERLAIPVADLFNAKDSADGLCILPSGKGGPLLEVPGLFNIKFRDGVLRSGLVDRAALRQRMVSTLPAGLVQYNKRFLRYEGRNGKVVAHFEDGSCEEGDLLIGAEGYRSPVRNQYCPALVPAVLPYWGIAGTVELDDANRCEQLASNVLYQAGRKSLTRKYLGNGLSWMNFACRSGDRYFLLWSLSMPQDVADALQITQAETTTALKLLAASSYFDQDALQILDLTRKEQMFPGYSFTSVLPESYDDPNFPFIANPNKDEMIVLVGDAAHKTTTQAGQGATAALSDADQLVKLLLSTRELTRRDLDAFESESRKTARSVVKLSVGNTRRIHERNLSKIMFANALTRFAGLVLRLYFSITRK